MVVHGEKIYVRFETLPMGAKFVDAFGTRGVKTSEAAFEPIAEEPDEDWYFHTSLIFPA